MNQQKQNKTKKRNEETQPNFPSLPNPRQLPQALARRGPSHRLPGSSRCCPFRGSFLLCLLRGTNPSPPSPVLTPLCAPNRNPAPWGRTRASSSFPTHRISLLAPHSALRGARAENQNWLLPPPLRAWPKPPCGQLLQGSRPQVGGAGLRDPQGSHKWSPAPGLKTVSYPFPENPQSQRGCSKVKSPYPWGQGQPHCPLPTSSVFPPFPSQPDPSHPPGLKI